MNAKKIDQIEKALPRRNLKVRSRGDRHDRTAAIYRPHRLNAKNARPAHIRAPADVLQILVGGGHRPGVNWKRPVQAHGGGCGLATPWLNAPVFKQ